MLAIFPLERTRVNHYKYRFQKEEKMNLTESQRVYRRKKKKEYYQRTANIYEKRPWSPVEDQMCLRHDITDTELSLAIKRSVSAIQKHRHLLKKEYGLA